MLLMGHGAIASPVGRAGILRRRAFFKDPPHDGAISNSLAEKVEFLSFHKLGRQQGVLDEHWNASVLEERPGLELADEFDLAEPAISPDVVEKRLLEDDGAKPLFGSDAAFDGRLPQGIDHAGTIDGLRATGRTSHTGNALPDRFAAQGAIEPTDLDEPHELVRKDVHVLGQGAASRTLAALVAIANVGPDERVSRSGVSVG
jgi:hypothetical protein